MKPLEKIGIRALRSMDPEMAHGWALRALQMGLAPAPGILTSTRLQTRFAGLDLPNPVGLAAGFDKNATALKGLHRAGFGFFEVGAATPRKQTGNSKPRLFRLTGLLSTIPKWIDNVSLTPLVIICATKTLPRGSFRPATLSSTSSLN